MTTRIKYLLLINLFLLAYNSYSQQRPFNALESTFKNPPASARPWVFWYWMQAAVSKEGITADLEAMKQAGIGGAYLMPIKDTTSPPLFQPVARQLTPQWWELVRFAMQEARRLDLKLAMHVSDGFALAGGPWITPELSMQKLVWTKTYAKGGKLVDLQLEQPETIAGYYRDISLVAYRTNSINAFRDKPLSPTVTTSNGARADFLSSENSRESFRSDTACWLQYNYSGPFTCRSIRIHVGGNSYQAQRLVVQSSNDGINFTTVTRLEPPRHGWQDTDEDVTHAIPATTAKYFRFIYNKQGSEPGSEDLDAAKWKPSLKLTSLILSDEPVINQYESKNGSIWRVSKNTNSAQVAAQDAIPLKNIINLSAKMDARGHLKWQAPAGNWIIVRIGHTSTGHTNATGGAGKGLECDKFNPAAIKIQFDNWFAQAFARTDPSLAAEVLKIFHVDSWECGSQNWSITFKDEFRKRRGYDPLPYLLTVTGVPVTDAAASEKFLHDMRWTIAELINDVFYKTLSALAHEKGCHFSAESVAPTMVSDGMLHYKTVDMPMGEFWLNSPTHDKPNDMLDAISGAHVYGKNIVQAEAFTTLRMTWGEHPGMLKSLGDRNFALGINKMVLHVFAHNPWLDRKPGMTLDGIGLYFQRDQTWFKQGKAWIDYLTRCQAMLQMGKPVVDIAVFTGEEIPRRSVLPDRLINTLPGIFGTKKLAQEAKRLENAGQPLRTIPDGVTHSANMADPEKWIDPLNGYSYDSFNPDALELATVKNGRIVMPGGASYAMLVIPGRHPMHPNSSLMSVAVARKVLSLLKNGATVLMSNEYTAAIGLNEKDDSIKMLMKELFSKKYKGKLVPVPYKESSFDKLGLSKDIDIENNEHALAWCHRQVTDGDFYFISNQKSFPVYVNISLRSPAGEAEIWDPVTGAIHTASAYMDNNRTRLHLTMEASQSLFIIMRKPNAVIVSEPPHDIKKMDLGTNWRVVFGNDSIQMNELKSWPELDDPAIKYYSGTALYKKEFMVGQADIGKTAMLEIGAIYNIATIKINGIEMATLWTRPYNVNIEKALRPGLNTIEIAVTNTWANRLIGDQQLPEKQRSTWTTAPFRLAGKPLLPAGITGNMILSFQ